MTLLKEIKFDSILKKFDLLDFGCDYLRLSYHDNSPYIESLFDKLDYDNSNFGILEFQDYELTFQKVPTSIGKGLIFSCCYNGISFPIFNFVVFDENTHFITGKYGKLDFYGSFFRLEQIKFFNDEFKFKFVELISDEDPLITRYDFRIDLFNKNKIVDVPTIENVCGYIHTQSKKQAYYTGDRLDDWSVGSKSTGTYFIRYYDKKLDTDKKNKWSLYLDFSFYKSVHRLEFEFQRKFCKGFHMSAFPGLTRKCINSLGLFDTPISGGLFYKYDESKEISEHNKPKYIRRFENMSLKMAKNGLNPLIYSYWGCYNNLTESEFNDVIEEFKDFISKKINL